MRTVAGNLSVTYGAQARSVPAARHALTEFARRGGAAPVQIEAVRLAASEALTNSVLHAYDGEPGDVYVTAAFVPGELWVLIADDGRGLEPQSGRPGLGLGLGLISQVTDELAIVPRAGGGTEVRMRFDLVTPAPAAGLRGERPRAGAEPRPGRVRANCLRGRQQYA
jgi:anti-sigma regulatory factor (Ser/Thr protein kinase)